MFSLINKKPHIFRLFTKTNHFQIRSRAPFLSKFKQSSKNTSEEPPSNIKIPTSTLIDLSYTNLEKELGLTLKQETKPEFKPRSNKNISKLEMQLEEITTESSLTANYKEDILKSKFGKHLKGHTIKQQKDTSDIEVMNNPQKEQKNRLENQLEEIEYKIKTAEDFKDSPDEILLRQYEEAQIKKKERTNAQLMRYVKGEEGIDYLTPPPNMFDDIEKEVSYLKEEFEEIYSKFTGSNNSQTRLSQFEWMEKKENLERLKELANCEEKEYPGSVKGANPEDDPEFYQDWFNRNAPPILVEASQEYQKLQREISGDFETNNQVTETLATLVGSDEPIREYSLNDPLDTMEETQTNLIVKTLTPSNEMDPYPEEDMMEWNQNVEHVERWAIFRMFPIWMNHLSQLEKMQESVRKNETQPKKEIILPSLYRYYNTLPKFARDSEFVKKLVRTFEFTKHNMSIKEKELSLNYICQFTLPMDELTESIVREPIISTKHFMTEEDEDRILNEGEPVLNDSDSEDEVMGKEKPGENSSKKKEEEDINDLTKSLEDEEKSKQKKQKKEFQIQLEKDLKDPQCDITWKYNMWPRPMLIDPDVSIAEPGPNLPLEFYDNDDGYWDDFIKEKERKYDLYPMIFNRPYFKH